MNILTEKIKLIRKGKLMGLIYMTNDSEFIEIPLNKLEILSEESLEHVKIKKL